jgi:uncharacterized protein (TIGR04562 family)
MALTQNFNTTLLDVMVGGESALDSSKLFIRTLEEAYSFLKSYGFDIHNSGDLKKLWYFHRRAIVLLEERILNPGENIPLELTDHRSLGDIRNLLIWASNSNLEIKDLQKWSCALLRVMHVFVHAEKDLFSFFAGEIQKQILTPIQACVFHEGDKIFLRHPFSAEEILLHGFDVKAFKTSSSSVIKMLAKPDVVALKVLDKIGVRFITESKFDAFRLALFLAEKNLLNFAHVMPDQSSNNLYPLNIFLKVIREVIEDMKISSSTDYTSSVMVDRILNEKLKNSEIVGHNLLRKENSFSDVGYKFIKFISRKLITIDNSTDEPFSFFYPFEVQIVDRESHLSNESGKASHAQYKSRQKNAARNRVFSGMDLK